MTNKFFAALAVLVAALLVLPSVGDAKGKSKYLVTTPHTAEQCLKAMDDVVANNPKLLQSTWWGCKAGDHTGYSIVDAESESDALNMIPEDERAGAKAVQVGKLTVAQIKGIHKQMKNEEMK